MLDLAAIRENPEGIRQALLKRGFEADFTELLNRDKLRRQLITNTENLKARRNETSKRVPAMKKAGENTDSLLAEMKALGEEIAKLDAQAAEEERRVVAILEAFPNIPAADVLPGGKENNQVVREWGAIPEFPFKPRDHVELVTRLGLVDYERGVKMGGSGYWLYRGDGARLEWAILSYFIEEHVRDGYEFMLPPHILSWECGYTAGQFPKFAGDVFHVRPDEGQDRAGFLLPTAETALINMHRDEILREDELPKKYFAYTPCYRKEAGSHRTAERGMIRGHQFNKVEMFQYTLPERSGEALDELVEKAERLVQGLGLHHRVSKLAAADCGAAMAKTYDIEVWLPSMKEYKEVSSASNAHDYQARRGRIRFKRKTTKKTEFVHTLNASGLATSRLLPAIVEQFQRGDGSVAIPEPLRKWMGKDTLLPPAGT